MSYCRFTDDSDVYAYACDGGVQFWVAGRANKNLDRLCNTYNEAYQYAKMLRDERGLNVPDYAIDSLRAEAIEEAKRFSGPDGVMADITTLVHDLFSALEALCDANECEYCILACEPYDQCPIDGLRRRVKECE